MCIIAALSDNISGNGSWNTCTLGTQLVENFPFTINCSVGLAHDPFHILCEKSGFSTLPPITLQIAKFMGPTWGLPGSCRPQMGPILTPGTLLSGLSTAWEQPWYLVIVLVTSHCRFPRTLHVIQAIFIGCCGLWYIIDIGHQHRFVHIYASMYLFCSLLVYDGIASQINFNMFMWPHVFYVDLIKH